MKSLYESAADAAISLLDKQIDKYNDQKDAAVKALEEQKEAAEEAYQAQIDALEEQIELIDKQISKKQEQIDKIQDAKKQRQAELDAAKALYELEKAQGQRSIQTLKDGQRVYINDPSSIRDAQNNVDDTKDELRISKIEKEISVLEKRKTSLEDQQDAIQKMIDASNKHYDELIKNTEAYWDSLIKGLESYKSRWEELKEIEERAEIENTLKQLGMSTDSILSMSDEAFQKYKNDYLNILADMYRGNDQMYDSLSKVTGIDFSTLNGYLADTAEAFGGLNELNLDQFDKSISGVADNLDTVKKAVTDTSNSISGTPGTTENSGEGGQGDDASAAVDSLSGSMKQFETDANIAIQNVSVKLGQLQRSIENVRDDIGTEKSKEDSNDLIGSIHALEHTASIHVPPVASQFESLKKQIEPSVTAINELKETLEELSSGEFNITVNTDTGNIGGPAFAKGTGGLTHNEKNAIRSEYNQPELAVFPDGHYELTTSPTVSDLPKGTVIYDETDTKKILNTNSPISGKAYANGTGNLTPLKLSDPDKYRMLTALKDVVLTPMRGLQDAFNTQTKQIESTVKQAVKVALQNNTAPTNVNMDVNITLPNVTNDSGVHYIEKELGNLSLKGLQYFKQK